MNPIEFVELVNDNKLEEVLKALSENPALSTERVWAIGTTALHCASHRGFTQIVSALLEHGADVHARETASNTIALHWASEGGHPAIARMLVEKGSDLSAVDDWYGLPPLGWASVVVWAPPFHEDRLTTVDYLLRAHAPVDIFSAVVLGQSETVKTIVASNKSTLTSRMGFVAAGVQPLHLAVSRQLTEMIQLLLDLGADIHTRSGSGVTPLGIAISRKDASTIRILMERGGRDEISTALVRGDLAAMAVHLTGEAVSPELLTTLLFLAARMGNAGAIKLLIGNGANPNARSRQLIQEMPELATPLHLAAMQGNDAVRALIEAGANPNPDPDGSVPTPLHLAASGGHIEAVRVLLQAGSDIQSKDKVFGATPQGWAEHGGHSEIVELLGKIVNRP